MRWLRSVSPLHPVPARLLGAILALTLLVAGLGTGIELVRAAPGGDANAPSPAGVTDAVIAQGVAPMPTDQVAWRVVQDTAGPVGQAQFQQRALGFAVATNDAILATDQATGAQVRFARGEAVFTADQTMQRREGLGSGPTPYDRLALVPADNVSDAGGDTLIFAGQPFAAPPGNRDLDLVKGNIYASGHDDNFTTDPNVPLLVLVLDGKIEVTAGGSTTTLAAGQAGAFGGTVGLHSLVNTGAGATFVAAIIGPAVPSESQESATAPPITTAAASTANATPETGQIVIQSQHCPASAHDLQTISQCFGQNLAGVNVTAKNASTGAVVSGQTNANGYLRLPNLPAGSYQVVFSPPQPAGGTFGVCGGQDQSADLSVATFTDGQVGLTLPAGKEYDCTSYTPDSQTATAVTNTNNASGAVMAIADACPSGFDAANATVKEHGAACQRLSGVTLHLTVGNQDQPQTTSSSGRASWQNVPPGEMTLTEDPPADQPASIAVCEYWTQQPDGTATDEGQLGPADTNGTQVNFTLQPGQVLSCWFDHVAADATTPAVPVEATSTQA